MFKSNRQAFENSYADNKPEQTKDKNGSYLLLYFANWFIGEQSWKDKKEMLKARFNFKCDVPDDEQTTLEASHVSLITLVKLLFV